MVQIVCIRHGPFYSRVSTNRLANADNLFGPGDWGGNMTHLWSKQADNDNRVVPNKTSDVRERNTVTREVAATINPNDELICFQFGPNIEMTEDPS